MTETHQTLLQAKAFDFAFSELVKNNRSIFEPLWTVDSWVKFLIWLALNCGLSGDKDSLELFANSLGAPLTRRMRKLFFERNLEKFCIIADPAEANIFVVITSEDKEISFNDVNKVFTEIGLNNVVSPDQSSWNRNDGMIIVPWKLSKIKS